MKTAETKTATSPHLHQNGEPFFQKVGRESAFFSDSQTDLQTKSFFSKQETKPFIQTKLTIGQPGDRYEQEADDMADQVIQRMNTSETVQTKPRPLVNGITPLIQSKCACEEKEQLQKKEEDEDRLGHGVQLKPVFGSDEPPPEEKIQRKCAECRSAEASAKEGEVEEKLHKKAEAGSSETNAPSSLESHLNSSRGSGSPLPADTQTQMESSFGADFSSVRIHTGSSAVQMNEDLHAQAFTHGRDIYFNSGKYDANRKGGNHLLAHELTHVVQQNAGDTTVQKQDEASTEETGSGGNTTTDAPWDPEVVLERYLQEWEDEKESIEDDVWDPDKLSDEGPSAWIGTGPQAMRKQLLLKGEYLKLGAEESYKNDVVQAFLSIEDPAEGYMKSLKQSFSSISGDEQAAMDFLNKHIHLGADPDNFIDNSFYLSTNAANAFPKFSWAIVRKLIAPSDYLISDTKMHSDSSIKYYDGYWSQLALDFYNNGLPVSYARALVLDYFSLIRSIKRDSLFKLPEQAWVKSEYVISTEEELRTEILKHCVSSFVYKTVSGVKAKVLTTWNEVAQIPWFSYDTRSISDFRKEYPNGFTYLDQFYDFKYKGAAYSLLEVAFILMFELAGIAGGNNPYKVLGLRSSLARNQALDVLNNLVHQAYQDFINSLESGNEMIIQLPADEKLLKAVNWSLNKGYAGTSISLLLENLDQIVLDILKSWGKQKGIKKLFTSAIGFFGGPLGRLATFAYNAYEAYDDAQDAIEIAQLVYKLIDVLTEARNSTSIVQTQRSAARLAETTVSIIPILLDRLGSKLLDRISKGVSLKDGPKMSEAKKSKLLDESSGEVDATKLTHDQLEAEVKTAVKSKVEKPHTGDYNAIIVLPNGHKYQRNKNGIWCRATEHCIPPNLDPDFVRELNERADQEPGSLFDDPRLHQTTKGNFGEVASDHMLKNDYDSLVGITRPENPDRGPGIDNVWVPHDTTHFDFTISETKFISDFDGSIHNIRMGRSISGPQLSDSWITGRNFNTGGFRLEDAVGATQAQGIRTAVNQNRVERLVIVVDQAGRTWTFEADSDGKPFKSKQ